MQRLRDLGEWKTREPAFAEFVNGWVSSGDIEGVTEYVSSLPDSDGRDILLASMRICTAVRTATTAGIS